MVRKGKQTRTSALDLGTTKAVLGSAATISLPDGRSFSADLLSTTGPLSVVPRFSREGLDYIARENFHHDGFYKSLRDTQYNREWEYVKSLLDPGSREWKMIALSYCTQVAIESSLIYPWLVPQARKWLRAKFESQNVTDDFEVRWEAYWDYCASDLELIAGRIYLRIGSSVRFQWFGEPPNAIQSFRYQITFDEDAG